MKITKAILVISIIANLILGFLYLRERNAVIKYHQSYKVMRDAILECEYDGGLFNATQEQMDDKLFSIDGRCLYIQMRIDGPLESPIEIR